MNQVNKTDEKPQDNIPAHKNVYTALAAAQAEMGPLIKGANNPHFKSKYADLADLVAAVRGPLNRHGMAFFHQIVRTEGAQDMRTVLMHGESETSIVCDVPLIVAKNDMQGMKSATTYAKRIGLESVSGVAPEDDDGNAASKAAPRTVTPDQFIKLRDKAEEAMVAEDKICAVYSAPSFEQFPQEFFDRAMKKLELTINAKSKPDDMDGDGIPDHSNQTDGGK